MKNISVQVIGGSALIVCPSCSFQKHMGVNVKKAKAVCPRCKENLAITFYKKQRKHFRKEVNIPGEIFITNASISVAMTVLDISCKGVRLQMQSNKHCIVDVGDTVDVKFILPDRKKTYIEANGKIVRKLNNNEYSIEFVGVDEYSPQMKAIGFWMR